MPVKYTQWATLVGTVFVAHGNQLELSFHFSRAV